MRTIGLHPFQNHRHRRDTAADCGTQHNVNVVSAKIREICGKNNAKGFFEARTVSVGLLVIEELTLSDGESESDGPLPR